MNAQMHEIMEANEPLTRLRAELNRLAGRIEAISNAMMTATAAATVVGAEPPSPGSANPPAMRKVLAPVPGLKTNPEVICKVKAALGLGTRKEVEVVTGVVWPLEETLIENLGQDGFSIKLGSFGKFSIRHRLGTYRKIPITGEWKTTDTKRKEKFVAIGRLRQLERVRSA